MVYILLIDDDQDIREILEIALSDAGYEVGTAVSGSGAMDLIAERHPDLIFVDLWLQGQPGEGFIEAYRALPDATAALVLLSAAPDLDKEAVRSGVDRYLAKPFELDELLAVVAELLPDADSDRVARRAASITRAVEGASRPHFCTGHAPCPRVPQR